MTTLNLNQQFTGCEYLMIDAANAFGLDKEVFEKRIAWTRENLDCLEAFVAEADDPVMFTKAVVTIRKVQKGLPTGHMVGLDSTTSGAQILSALTGCRNGMLLTNLVDPNKRYDCYTEIFLSMVSKLEEIECEVTRAEAKEALMTMLYGSSAKPKEVFGDDTIELEKFNVTVQEDLPGAYEFLQEAKDAWQPFALNHSWTLPDMHVASVNVMEKKTIGIEIDELDHHTFNHTFNVNEGTKSGVSLAANITHSIDAYIPREIKRRSSYNPKAMAYYRKAILELLESRSATKPEEYNTDNVLSLVILDGVIDIEEVSNNDLFRFLDLFDMVEEVGHFETLSIHDQFNALANYCNELRFWYKEILAELAESNILSDIFSEIYGEEVEYDQVEGGYTKQEAAELIRNSVYAIC